MKRKQEFADIFTPSESRTSVPAEDDIVPLRKILKSKTTGREENFMPSYYQEHHNVQTWSSQHVEEFRWQMGISVEGINCPKPIRQFHESGLSLDILQRLVDLGMETPTPIQMQAIPCIMSGRDLIGLAETGSGKTLAYLLPMLKILTPQDTFTRPGDGPRALIIAPTRELVGQIFAEIQKLNLSTGSSSHMGETSYSYQYPNITVQTPNSSSFPIATSSYASAESGLAVFPSSEKVDQNAFTSSSGRFKVMGVVGGVPLSSQAIPLKKHGVDILVATPGRLADLINRGDLKLNRIFYLVLDEVDRMLSMNMEQQLRWIIAQIDVANNPPRPRQTLLWTATLPDELERLARTSVLNPITIHVGAVGQAAGGIIHQVQFCYYYQKKNKLLEILRSIEAPPVLIFCNSSTSVDKVVRLLKGEQFHVVGLHAEKTQQYRFKVMKAMTEGQVDILVATDLASRGLDLPNLDNVALWELPDDINDYVQRVGRTGRMGKIGTAHSLLTLDCKIANELKEMLEACKQEVPRELMDTRNFGKMIIKTELGDRVVQ